jgi:hypothetical protein
MRFNPQIHCHTDIERRGSNVSTYPVTALNSARGVDNLIIFNGYAETAQTPTNEFGMEFLIAPVGGAWLPDANGDIKCKVEKIRPAYNSSEPADSPNNIAALTKMDIIKGKAVLSGHGAARLFLSSLAIGNEVYVNWGVSLENNPQIKALTEVVGGGTICLKNAAPQPYIATDGAREKDRHPRTAVGYTSDRIFLFYVVVDGRNESTIGVSTRELSDIMLFAEADNALNLDGGGSSCMVINGTIKNIPSDGSPRSVVNGLLLAKLPPVANITIPPALADSRVQVYPNPAGKIVSFSINPERDIRTLQINICDLSGKRIKEVCREKDVKRGDARIYICETEHFPPGAYLYEVIEGDKRISGKILMK